MPIVAAAFRNNPDEDLNSSELKQAISREQRMLTHSHSPLMAVSMAPLLTIEKAN